MKRLLPALLVALPLVASAQRPPAAKSAPAAAKSVAAAKPGSVLPGTLPPQPVPAEVQFAGLRLRLSDGGRAAVQQKVDALRRHPGSYFQRVAAADAAFPIIERVFQEEGVPLDFRFLCIQESGLQGDAQSIHDAIGYWQFKREAATDFGLEVSDDVDERKHLVAATHGAAKYLLRSQRMYQNWLHTLLSYNLGLTGVKPYTLPTDAKATEMQITEQTHPYILTFLAHKLAYEPAIGANPRPAMLLREYPAVAGQPLAALAQAIQTSPAELTRYNRWLLGAAVPANGKVYTALVPVTDSLQLLAMSVQQRQTATKLVTPPQTDARNAAYVNVNGLRAVVALPGETKEDLARRAGVKLRKFMQFNDLMPFDNVVAGQPYFTQKKRDKAATEYHVTQPGESVVTVSQKYGLRAKAIRSKNRMARNEPLQPGRVLWLQHTRPRAVAVEYVQDKTGAVAAAMERPADAPAPAPGPPAPKPAPAKRKPAAEAAEPYTGRTAAAQRVIDDAPEAGQDSSRVGGLLNKLTRRDAPVADEPATDTTGTDMASTDAAVATVNEVTPDTPPATPTPAAATDKPSRTLYNGTADAPKQLPTSAPLADEPTGTEPDEEPVPAAPKPAAPVKPAPQPKPVAAVPATSAPTTPAPAAKPAPAAPKPAPAAATPTTAAAPSKPAATPPPATADPAMTPGAGWPIPANGLHTVQPKETLYAVGRRYGLRPADLIQWNGLPANPSLRLGQVLRLTPPDEAPAATAPKTAQAAAKPASAAPSPAKPASAGAAVPKPATTSAKPVAAGTIKHTVVAKETLFSISRKYNVKPAQILEWNHKTEETVRLGEVLTIQPGQ